MPLKKKATLLLWVGPIFLFLTCLSVTLLPIYRRESLANVFGQTSYFIIFLLTACWVATLVTELRRQQFCLRSFLFEHRTVIVTSLVLTAIVAISVPGGFKVLSDETNLLSVSQSMVLKRQVYNTTLAKFYYGNFNALNHPIPTRPLLFPFLVSLTHSLFGYRPSNIFSFNLLCLFITISTLGIVAQKISNRTVGLATLFFSCSFPAVTLSARSGGFDLLSSYFFIVTLLTAYRFMQRPARISYALFLFSALMFAHVRYETIAIGGLIGLGVIALGYLKKDLLVKTLYPNVVVPLFLAPLLWQRILTQGQYENPPGVPLLSVAKFIEHAKLFFSEQVNFSFSSPYAIGVNLAAALILCYFVYSLPKSSKLQKWQIQFAILSVASFAVMQAIYFAHHFGVYTHPTQSRFFIPMSLAAAFMPALFFASVGSQHLIRPTASLCFAIAMFFLYHPFAVEGRFPNTLVMIRETNFFYDFLERQGRNDILVVSDRPGQYTAMGYGAVDFNYANSNMKELQSDLKRHLYNDIFVLQKISYATDRAVDENRLNESFTLTAVKEIQLTATEYQRISKVSLAPEILPRVHP